MDVEASTDPQLVVDVAPLADPVHEPDVAEPPAARVVASPNRCPHYPLKDLCSKFFDGKAYDKRQDVDVAKRVCIGMCFSTYYIYQNL